MDEKLQRLVARVNGTAQFGNFDELMPPKRRKSKPSELQRAMQTLLPRDRDFLLQLLTERWQIVQLKNKLYAVLGERVVDVAAQQELAEGDALRARIRRKANEAA